jgi:hypothetical protein
MRNVRLLEECRFVTKEVGSLSEAWAMSTEVRGWWISEILKEREGRPTESQTSDGRRVVRAEIPRKAGG